MAPGAGGAGTRLGAGLGPRGGVTIRTVAAAAGLSPARVHQITAGADLDGLDAALGELRAAGWPASEDPGGLRQFWEWAGRPPFREMAARCGHRAGVSTMNTALCRDELPRLWLLDAIVEGCGGTEEDRAGFSTALADAHREHVRRNRGRDARRRAGPGGPAGAAGTPPAGRPGHQRDRPRGPAALARPPLASPAACPGKHPASGHLT